MSTVKSFKVKGISYGVKDDKSLQVLTASERTSLLTDGKYRGETVTVGKIFELDNGKVEQFGDNSTTNFSWQATSLYGDASPTVLGYFNNKYIACVKPTSDNYEYIYTSTDLTSWTKATNPLGENRVRALSLTYFNEKYIISCQDNNSNSFLMHSTDLENWTKITDLTMSDYGSFAQSDSLCMFKEHSTGNIYTSTDGINWTQKATSSFTTLPKLLYANGLFIASGMYETKIATSTDGSTWTQIDTPNYSHTYLFYDGSKYIIGGYVSRYDYTIRNITSTDLTNWETHNTGEVYPTGTIAYNGEDTYVAGEGDRYQTSSNGIDWSWHAIGSRISGDIYYGPAGFIASAGYSVYKGSAVTTHDYSMTPLSYNKTEVDTLTTGALKNTSTGTNSLTIGGTASSTSNSFNAGVDSAITGTGDTAVGYNSHAAANDGTAVGANSFSAGWSVSVGTWSNTAATGCVAVGNSAETTAGFATALGFQAKANAAGAIALGNHPVNSEAGTFKVSLATTNVAATDESTGLYTLLNSNGKIPKERLTDVIEVVTEMPSEPVAGKIYFIVEE